MERLPTWVSLLALSIVIIAAAIDQFPNDGVTTSRESYCLATAIISLIFSVFFIAGNLVDRLGNMVVGNCIENGELWLCVCMVILMVMRMVMRMVILMVILMVIVSERDE
jgi:hypothetical protein